MVAWWSERGGDGAIKQRCGGGVVVRVRTRAWQFITAKLILSDYWRLSAVVVAVLLTTSYSS